MSVTIGDGTATRLLAVLARDPLTLEQIAGRWGERGKTAVRRLESTGEIVRPKRGGVYVLAVRV